MAEPAKFLKVSYRIWWFIFLGLQILLLVLMIASLATPKWVYSNNSALIVDPEWLDLNNLIYDGSNFKGGLYKCTDSCNTDWGTLAKNWCDYWSDVKKISNQTAEVIETKNQAQSVCYLYFVLYIGMNVYSGLEIIALIILCKWTVAMFLYWKKVQMMMVCSMVCAGCVWGCHYIAFIFYMIFAQVNFKGNCNTFYTDGTNPKLCASSGPSLALVVAIILPVVVTLYCIVGCNLKNKYGPQGLQLNPEENVPTGQNNPGGINLDNTQNYPVYPPPGFYPPPGVYPPQAYPAKEYPPPEGKL